MRLWCGGRAGGEGRKDVCMHVCMYVCIYVCGGGEKQVVREVCMLYVCMCACACW